MATDADQITDDIQIVEPNTVEVADPVADQPQRSEIEELAAEKGWSPKEQWRGKDEDWVSARDFVAKGLDKGRNAGEEIRSMRQTLYRTTKSVEQMHQQGLARQREELEARFLGAVEAGDTTAAARARDDINRIEASVAPSLPPEVDDFRARNQWFGTNQEATALAQVVAQRMAEQGHGPQRQLEEAEREVRKRFPEVGGGESRPTPKPPAAVNAPAARAPVKAATKGFNDLPREAQEAGRRMAGKMGFTLEDYAKTWLSENVA
jgi:hypothetical protein